MNNNIFAILEELNSKATFTISDIRKRISSAAHAKLFLYRLTKKGLIKRITKNVYTTKNNIYTIASHVVYPSYISFWPASAFLGYTEQILNTVVIATTRRVKPVLFNGYNIEFVSLKDFFGYRKISTIDGEIFLVEPEKLLIDCFLRPEKIGNFDEIIKVFEKADISKEKLIEYLRKIRSKAVVKRVGCLLENIRRIDVSKHFKFDNNYIILNPFSNKWKTNNTKWRVKV